MEENGRSKVVPVTVRQMFSNKTTIEGNHQNFFKWFFGLAMPGDALLYIFNVATNSRLYHSTTGIYFESVLTFGIFVVAWIIAQRKSARLIGPDVERH